MGQADSNHKLSRFQQVEQLGLFDFFNYDYIEEEKPNEVFVSDSNS